MFSIQLYIRDQGKIGHHVSPANPQQSPHTVANKIMNSTMTESAKESEIDRVPAVVRGGALPLASQVEHFRGTIPNTQLAISLISAILGGVFCVSISGAVRPLLAKLGASSWTWATPQLGIYFAALGAHHLSEFWTTAYWNPQKLSVDCKWS